MYPIKSTVAPAGKFLVVRKVLFSKLGVFFQLSTIEKQRIPPKVKVPVIEKWLKCTILVVFLFLQRNSFAEDGSPNHRVPSRRQTGPTLITQQASAAPGTSL